MEWVDPNSSQVDQIVVWDDQVVEWVDRIALLVEKTVYQLEADVSLAECGTALREASQKHSLVYQLGSGSAQFGTPIVGWGGLHLLGCPEIACGMSRPPWAGVPLTDADSVVDCWGQADEELALSPALVASLVN